MKSPRAGKASAGDKASNAHNLVDAVLKKTFIEMRDSWESLNSRANSAAAKRRQFQKEIKEAGYSMQQIKISLLLQTPEGEAEFKAEMVNRLLAAAYSDSAVGDQLSAFLEPDRTPATDRAAKEGQTDAMQNKAAQPKYDPSTPQATAYMEAYHREQERQVKAGIGKLEDNKGAANGKAKPIRGGGRTADEILAKPRGRPKAAAKVAKPAAGKPRGRPSNASKAASAGPEPITRAALAAAKDAEPDSYFSKSAKTSGNA